MEIANRPLNYQAIAIEEAETEIRRTVKNEYFKQTPATALNRMIMAIIKECTKKIKIKDLREAVYKSLWNFYQRQYNTLKNAINGKNLLVFIAIIRLAETSEKSIMTSITKPQAVQILRRYDYKITGNINSLDNIKIYGVPAQKFSQYYFFGDPKEKDLPNPPINVKKVFDKLIEQYPYDPNDQKTEKHKYLNSLRNRAEMEVRYQGHLDNIEQLKAEGHKLVIASTHADCSERCKPWQGRVYSLDGTEGTTEDGRAYVPLEDATDVDYETNSGKHYKNGLLGFNCRHYLVPYKEGYKFPHVSEKEERKEYEITLRQRQLERYVRRYRTEAVMYKGVDKEAYNKARNKAIKWNNEYINYSRDHERAYYPSRTKIL